MQGELGNEICEQLHGDVQKLKDRVRKSLRTETQKRLRSETQGEKYFAMVLTAKLSKVLHHNEY